MHMVKFFDEITNPEQREWTWQSGKKRQFLGQVNKTLEKQAF